MDYRVSGHRIRQFGGGCHKAFKLKPTTGHFGCHIKGGLIPLGLQKGSAQGFEGAKCVVQGGFCIRYARVTQPFRILPSLTHDPVMGLDHRIGNPRVPFYGADRENGQAPVAGNVSQAIGKISFALAAQLRNTVGRQTIQNIGRQPYSL
tara:strand:+ start:147 stop:593 length:447 start_codon:yes stop_codon:yes gene_type:complete